MVTLSQTKPKDNLSIKKIRGIPKFLSNKDLNKILEVIKICNNIEPNKWPKITKYSTKSNVNKGSLDLLKLLLSYCSQESGLAEKLIADTDDLRSILNSDKDNLKVFSGWRNEVFGKFVNLMLNGEIGFTLKNNNLKKIEL